MENSKELLLKHEDTKGANSNDDALINKVAMEMMGGSSSNKDLMSFQKAPESLIARYGNVTLNGLGYVPEGVVNAVKENVNHPGKALATLGMGAGMAVVLKTVLPESGPAGKIAGAALGAYFTYKAAEPIIDGYKQATHATTMAQLDHASRQIGNAGGTFIVDSAIAAVGYKGGAALADRALAMPAATGFKIARENFYDNMGARLNHSLGITSESAFVKPEMQGVVPPYMLDELAKRNPGNSDFLKTRNQTLEMQTKGHHGPNQPRAGQDFKGAREVYDAGGQEVQPGTKVRFEGEKPSGNVDADKVYEYTGQIREFYEKVHGRNSIDGKGMKMVSTVNYGENFENAFWDGKQMTYGRPGENSPFKSFILRDVTGHEITHGITEMEANEKYYGQSGALNESNSDIYGALVDQYVKGQTADKASWLVGEGIWKENVKGRALRDMLNPGTAYNDAAVGKDPQPAHMDKYVKTWGDNGGVHINSGIPNKAFATFAQSVGGNAWEAPGHIWFEARKAAGSNPSFSSFAAHTLEAAGKLPNAGEVVPKLQAAWKGVGVVPNINAVDTISPGATEGALSFIGKWFKKAS